MTEIADALHFSDAYSVVAQGLSGAREQVLLGLAEACGRPLFDLLLACSRKGVLLTVVMPSQIKDQAPGIAWERLTALGAQVHPLRHGAPLLHTSVCVVDGAMVLSGALARLQVLPDSETLGVLMQADTAYAIDCARGISQWAVAHALNQKPMQSPALSPEAPSPATDLAAFDDPLQWAPAWQTALLEAHALALQTELAEMHRTLNAFDQAQDAAIGPLLRECLDAKRQHLQQLHAQSGDEETRAQAEQAQENFDRYTQAQGLKPAPAPALDAAAQSRMKQLYRKLAMRLHPDRVDEDEKWEAQGLFQRLQAGYENNDLSALQALEQQVLMPSAAGGASLKSTKNTVSTRSPAQIALALQGRLVQYQRERQGILRSATWRPNNCT